MHGEDYSLNDKSDHGEQTGSIDGDIDELTVGISDPRPKLNNFFQRSNVGSSDVRGNIGMHFVAIISADY